jgi:hypothetical protein
MTYNGTIKHEQNKLELAAGLLFYTRLTDESLEEE